MSKTWLLLAMYLLLLPVTSGCKVEESNVTLNEAKATAGEELAKLSYDIESMEVTADEQNSKWEKYVSIEPSVLDGKTVKGMRLEDKDYWAIYFRPEKRSVLGGDAWVFVDKASGKVIGILRGR